MENRNAPKIDIELNYPRRTTQHGVHIETNLNDVKTKSTIQFMESMDPADFACGIEQYNRWATTTNAVVLSRWRVLGEMDTNGPDHGMSDD